MSSFFEGQTEKVSNAAAEVTLLDSPKEQGQRRVVRFISVGTRGAGAFSQPFKVWVYRGINKYILWSGQTAAAIDQAVHSETAAGHSLFAVLEGGRDMRLTFEGSAPMAALADIIIVYGHSRSQ